MHNQLSGIIVDAAFQVHSRLGPGLLESVYETVLAHELAKRGLKVLSQVPIAIAYDDLAIQDAFKADLIIKQQLDFRTEICRNTATDSQQAIAHVSQTH